MQIKRFPFLIPALAALLLCAGCSDDNPADPVDENIIGTWTELMQNFEAAYDGMNADLYNEMLDDRFRFYYLDGTDHDHDTEAALITNTFSGNPPTNPEPGAIGSGIRSVEVRSFNLLEEWDPVSPAHPDFGSISGAMRGFYEVYLVLHHDAGTMTINTHQFFYAVPADVVVGGAVLTEWKLLGQEDISGKAANDDMSWSQLKNLFL